MCCSCCHDRAGYGLTSLHLLAGTDMRALNIGSCTLVGDIFPLAACTALESFGMAHCSRVTGPMMREVLGTSLPRPFCLSRINLSRPLPAACHSTLTSLDLNGCDGITDCALEILGPSLTDLTLFGLDKLTDTGLMALAENCPALTEANLGHCGGTEIGITAIVEGCADLRHLEFALPVLTDDLLSALAGAAKMEALQLGGPVGDKDLVALSACRSLVYLTLESCGKLTDKGLAALQSAESLTSIQVFSRLPRVSEKAIAALEDTGCEVSCEEQMVDDGDY